MEKLTIIFSRSSSKIPVFSWLIMATEGTNFSHVALRMIDSETNQPFYYQASHTMVNEMGEEQFLKQEIIVESYDFEITPEIKKSIKEFAIDNLGVPYGVISIIGLAIVQLAKWLGIKIKNPLSDEGKTYVCSELVATILSKKLNVVLPDNPDDITPKDLHAIVSKLPRVLI